MHLGVEFFVFCFFFKGADLIHPPWDPFIYMFRYLISVRGRASTLTDLTHTKATHAFFCPHIICDLLQQANK